MPNRILKETICTSDSIDKLSWFEEVLFYRLIVACDDFGRYDGRAAIIKNRLFPLKDNLTLKQVTNAINKLASAGLVALYEHEGKPFLCLLSWNEHQNVRAKKSKYPAPDSTCKQLQAIDSNCNQMQANVPVIQSNPIQSESNANSAQAHTQKREKFVAPTVEAVAAYIREKGYPIDAQHFVDYYQRQGWKLSNGQPMKDWQSAVRLWSRDKKPKKNSPEYFGKGPIDAEATRANYERLLAEEESA